MDDYLAGFFTAEEFVTALLVDVTRPGELRVVAAGHPSPRLLGPVDASWLDLPHGLPLGLGLGVDGYAEATVPWNPGDRLLMFTDGLSEARNRAGEFFPVPSLGERLRSGPVDMVIGEVAAAVSTYVPGGRLEDDLAVVLIEHLAEVPAPARVRPRSIAAPWTAAFRRCRLGAGCLRRSMTLATAIQMHARPRVPTVPAAPGLTWWASAGLDLVDLG